MFIWAKLKGYAAAAGVILAAIASAYFLGRSDGKNIAHDKTRDDLIEDMQEQKELRDEVSRLSDDDLDRRVSKWTRK